MATAAPTGNRRSVSGPSEVGGIPREVGAADDHGTPRLAMVGAVSQTRSHCTLCIAPVICRRHRRWLGIPAAPGQFDLGNTPEIITANRRRDRLLRSQEHPHCTDIRLQAAEGVTISWLGMFDLLSHRRLVERWNQRRARIASATGREPPERLVVLPETVVLAEIFCGPYWRRQIATASRYGHVRFYLHVAHRLRLPAGFANHVDVSADPLRNWVDQHQAQRRAAYTAAWHRPNPATANTR